MSARTSTPAKEPRAWIACRVRGAKAAMLGRIEASDMNAAIAAAAGAYGVDPKRVLVVRQVRKA